MKRVIGPVGLRPGSIALTAMAVVVLLVAQPAAAATVTSVTGTAEGYFSNVSLFGGPPSSRGPAPTVTLAPDASNSPQSATDSDGATAQYGPATIFSASSLTVTTQGALGPSGSVTSAADATDVGPDTFTADSTHSDCTASETGVSAATTIVNGVLVTKTDSDGNPETTVTIPVNPAPNLTYEGTIDQVGDSFRAVFNEQVVGPDGSITVIAYHLYMLGPTAVGDLIVGRAICGVSVSGAVGPTAALVATPSDGPAPLGTTLDSSASGAGETTDTITARSYDFGDGTSSGTISDAAVAHTYAAPGAYTATVTVTDTQGGTDTASTVVLVREPPVADLQVTQTTGGDPLAITADASASDPGADAFGATATIVSYSWNFGDGSVTTTASPTVQHTYASPGSYTVSVTVTNSNGDADAAPPVSVVVESPPPSPPDGPGPGDSGGSAGLSRRFFFAEGSTLPGFEEYLLVFNPGTASVAVQITYILDDGTNPVQHVDVPGGTRVTVHVPDAPGVGHGRVGVGAVVEATEPVAAERAMYFDASVGGLAVNGAHAVVGVPSARLRWDFAEGTTQPGFREYLTIVNPGTVDTDALVAFAVEGGGFVVERVPVGAGRRATLDVNAAIPGVVGHSTTVTSEEPLIVERPMYFDAVVAGLPVNGGHVSFGATPSSTVAFAEGNVLPDFRQFLTLANPDDAASVAVTLDYQLENTGTRSHVVEVAPGSRRTVQVFSAEGGGVGAGVSDPVSQGVSVRVSVPAGRVIVAERPMYFSRMFPGFTSPVSDGHTTVGSPIFAERWVFAEGTTLPGFDTFITIQNPGSAQVATITYYTDTGEAVARDVALAAASRTTVQVFGDADQGGLALVRTGVSFVVSAPGDVLVERPLYVSGAVGTLPAVDGGTNVVGLPLFD